MKLAVTGFVSDQAGSVASANALLLRGLLDRGCQITFFSKSSFVDPRPLVGSHAQFKFVEAENYWTDRIRAATSSLPILGGLTGILDAASYHRLLVHRMRSAHAKEKFDLCLWLGDYASARVPGLPTVSFVQGPPGTDARSILRHFDEIRELGGLPLALKWKLLAHLRLSRLGRPAFAPTDHFIVGSEQSRQTMERLYRIPAPTVSTLPYPIDLNLFRPAPAESASPALRCLWLGRIIPRKRLDLFLKGAVLAIKAGEDIRLTLVGDTGFVPGYEKWIAAFPYPDRLNWQRRIARAEVPGLLKTQDVLIQPSDEENFGSSVAEAQACGLPTIIGQTNGNADYLTPQDIRLADDEPTTLARALQTLAQRKRTGSLGNVSESRSAAETFFAIEHVTENLVQILNRVKAASSRKLKLPLPHFADPNGPKNDCR